MPDAILHRPAPPAFSARMEQLAIELLTPLRPVTETMRRTQKFKQIATSVREIGVVEPLVVARDRRTGNGFIVLDGHMRLEVLKDIGEASALCLIATDDEAYTYNNRINRLAIIQEHRMILKAIERGVSEDRLAAVLSVNTDNIRRKRRLLDGICGEAAALLEDKHVSINSFDALRKMLPDRQVEAAELMVAMNKYTVSYVRTLLAATPQAQLVPGKRRGAGTGVTEEQLALMQRESAGLDREFRLVDETYGADHLDLVLAKGYLARLIENPRVAKYLRDHHRDIALEFIRIVEQQATAV
jgi:RepB plasmid partitioning protein/ParB-like nuclease domain